MPARSLSRLVRSRALGRLLAVVGAAFVVLGVTTLPASAHHPIVSGTATCNGTISYTSTAWQSGNPQARANADVRIQAKINGSWVQVGSGAYTSADHFTFSGTFTEPVGTLPFQLRAYAAASWGDGAAGGYSSEVTVGAPSGCQSSSPQATVSHTCTGYTASLDNRASSEPVDFTVTVNGTRTTKSVARDSSALVTGSVHAGTSYVITVDAGGHRLTSSSFDTHGCQAAIPPTAKITTTCGTYTVTIANAGSSDAGYVVRQGSTSVKSGHVPAGGTTSYTSPVLTAGTYHVAVTSGGSTLVDQAVGISGCQPTGQPAATATLSCAGYDLALVNTGGGSTTVPFEVTINGVTTTVHANGTTQHVTGQMRPGTNTFSVSQSGQVLVSKTFDTTSQCSSVQPPVVRPTAQVSVDCTHGFTTTLDNTASTVPTTFVVTTGVGTTNATQHDVHVTAGSTSSPSWPLGSGSPQTVSVSAPQMTTVVKTFTGTCATSTSTATGGPTSVVGAPTGAPTSVVGAPQTGSTATSSGTATASATSTADVSATATSSATPSTQVSAPSSLPKTGSNISSMLLVTGIGLLLTGGMLMLLRRVDATPSR